MRKTKGECLEPGDFYVETRHVVERLSELALFLNVQKPSGIEEFSQLTKQEAVDFFVVSRARADLLQKYWEDEADKLIAHALETGVVFPASNDPKS